MGRDSFNVEFYSREFSPIGSSLQGFVSKACIRIQLEITTYEIPQNSKNCIRP